jgi:hypothetical protein
MTPTQQEPRTAAAIESRRASIAAMTRRVDRALQQMRREHATVTAAAVARRAGVSRSFLYQNAGARALVTAAATGHAEDADARADSPAAPRPEDRPLRERALNTEDELTRAHGEIASQRGQIGTLMGRIRDLEHDMP